MGLPLDESIAAGQLGHIGDHETIHDLLNDKVAKLADAQSWSALQTMALLKVTGDAVLNNPVFGGGPFITPQYTGAVGDGVADDTQAIGDYFDEIGGNNGGPIGLWTPGIYMIDATIPVNTLTKTIGPFAGIRDAGLWTASRDTGAMVKWGGSAGGKMFSLWDVQNTRLGGFNLNGGAYSNNVEGIRVDSDNNPSCARMFWDDMTFTNLGTGVGFAPPMIEVNDAVMTAASALLTSASAAFTAAMAFGSAKNRVYVQGAGAAGGVLNTTIASYISPTQVTLATTASTTVSGAALASYSEKQMDIASFRSVHFYNCSNGIRCSSQNGMDASVLENCIFQIQGAPSADPPSGRGLWVQAGGFMVVTGAVGGGSNMTLVEAQQVQNPITIIGSQIEGPGGYFLLVPARFWNVDDNAFTLIGNVLDYPVTIAAGARKLTILGGRTQATVTASGAGVHVFAFGDKLLSAFSITGSGAALFRPSPGYGVTGSRSGGTALTNLLAALHAQGVITNNTTA